MLASRNFITGMCVPPNFLFGLPNLVRPASFFAAKVTDLCHEARMSTCPNFITGLCVPLPYRGTSLIRIRPPPQDYRRTLGIFLL